MGCPAFLANNNIWVSLIVGGLANGFLYALIALGYTLVYGVLRLINFAHSEVMMAGGFGGLFAMRAVLGTSTPGGVLGDRDHHRRDHRRSTARAGPRLSSWSGWPTDRCESATRPGSPTSLALSGRRTSSTTSPARSSAGTRRSSRSRRRSGTRRSAFAGSGSSPYGS